MNTLQKITTSLLRYNVDVFVMFAVISYYSVYNISVTHHDKNFNFWPLLVANILGVIIIYLYNKTTDINEDNRIYLQIQKHHTYTIYILIFILFSVSSGIYISYNDPILVIEGASMFIIGILYSHHTRFGRLKNIFILKNVLPALLWYISIISISSYLFSESHTHLAKIFLPVFIVAFLFEIFWDIPDSETDKKEGVYTLPNTLGIFYTKVILILSFVLVSFLFTGIIYKLITLCITLFLINTNKKNSKLSYHVFLFVLAIIALVLHLLY